jgi:CRISPR-associated protein Csd1
MILQALKELYDRKIKEDDGIPLSGFSREKVSHELVIDENSKIIQINDIRQKGDKGKLFPKQLVVPEAQKRSANIAPNFLWDNTKYVLGIGKEELSEETFEAFKELAHKIGDTIDDIEMKAVLKFLDQWDPNNIENRKLIDPIAGSNLVFRVSGRTSYIHDNPQITEAWLKYCASKEDSDKGMCLVLGKEALIARLHPPIRGVRDAQSSGANIVNFNLPAFCSYGKEQGYNAPVSKEAAFAYTTVLNYLLSDSRRRIQIGDATTVFWAEKPSPLEDWLSEIFNPQQEDTATISEVRMFLESLKDGKMPDDIESGTKFYILGLSPNASRLSIRFWYAGTVGDLSQKIAKHFRDIAIERQYDKDREFPSLWQLLSQTALRGETKNINPLLSGEFMKSLLMGYNYPLTMLSALLERVRAGGDINYLKVSMIKGILVRNYGKEVKMSLDKENKETAYLLGRLFAVMEKAQQDALGENLNATIKDKYYSSASSTPVAAFPILLRLNKYHTSKGEHGGYYDSLIAEIMEELPAKKFPAHLSLEEQGLFAVGYYHQRNDFYKKREK